MPLEVVRCRAASSGARRLEPARGLLPTLLAGLLAAAAPAGAFEVLESRLVHDLGSGLEKPTDVAVSPSGLAHVADGLNHRIAVFDATGRLVRSVGVRGDGAGELEAPLGVSVGGDGVLAVADSGNRRVQLFAADGRFLRSVSVRSEDARPLDPTDAVLDTENRRLFVVDNDNHRVHVLRLPEGRLETTAGRQGEGAGELTYPFLAALDRDGGIAVVDVINARVQRLGADGSFGEPVAGFGVRAGRLYRPKGVAVDARGRIWVSDSYLGVVQVFGPDGAFLAVLGDERRRVRRFESPLGLAFGPRGRLHVVEMRKDRVRVLELTGAGGKP